MADPLKKRMMYAFLFFLLVLATHPDIDMGVSILSVGEDGEGMMKMEMESETSRRVLLATAGAQKKYISYGALKGDFVPCTQPGAPYYNCRALPKANTYSRGCGIITRCARDGNP